MARCDYCGEECDSVELQDNGSYICESCKWESLDGDEER